MRMLRSSINLKLFDNIVTQQQKKDEISSGIKDLFNKISPEKKEGVG